MRKLILIRLAFLCLFSKAQSKVGLPLSPDSTIVYQETVQLDTTYKKDHLYSAAKTWFVNTFANSKAVIQSDDQLDGTIIGKAYFNLGGGLFLTSSLGDYQRFLIKIDVKDGKYRYMIYGFLGSFTLYNNTTIIDVSKSYVLYLHDKSPKGFAISRQSANEKLSKGFESLNAQMINICASLNYAMKSSKADTF